MIILMLILTGGIVLVFCGGVAKTRDLRVACFVMGGLLIVFSAAVIFLLQVILKGMRIE
jgi:hypothetical protein